MDYEMVIGLEVHCELSTKTKIFCGCSTKFGGDPNTHVCEVCSGMPGTLPTLNRSVVEFACKTGTALNCEITRYNKFDRKNYFYPDLPKAYQVSQLYLPICRNGSVELMTSKGPKTIGIHEIHMEEDAGKLVHDPITDMTLVDYNRCGVPLLEIVSEPDFRTAEEVTLYLEKLRDTLRYLGVSDCKMQEGSMRADVNLSVRPRGEEKFGTRTEMKNIASLKAITRAIEYEFERQVDLIEAGGRVVQETRRWSDEDEETYSMRSKENAQDYKYFPEPDLMPIVISEEYLDEIRNNMPELADAKKQRYMDTMGLPEYDASILTADASLVSIFERTAEITNSPKDSANWILTDLLKIFKDMEKSVEDVSFRIDSLAEIIILVNENKINRKTGKEVLREAVVNGIIPADYVKENGLLQVSDASSLEPIVAKIVENNKKAVDEYLAGNTKSFQFLVGQVMKELKGKADPKLASSMIKKIIEG